MPPQPAILVLLTISFCLTLISIKINSAHSADTATINTSNALGVLGTLLASPPGSCTGVPNGFIGDCETRGAAAVEAWVDGNFSHGTNWSDLNESSTSSPIYTILPPPEPKAPTDIGTSWIPEFCNQPSCGHLLKGDVVHVDENGDGKFDDTWIDDGDGIRETGEVDRLRADQFAWGATSTILNFNNLGGPSNLQIIQDSGVTPPGLARARVRVALGKELECIVVTNSACVLDGVVEAPNSITDDFTNPNDASTLRDNNEFFGYCDPDKFVDDLLDIDFASVQRQLDNCLWKVGSSPVTAPINASVTGEGSAIREVWIDQRVVKYTASSTPDRQDFVQSWLVHYGFQRKDSSGDPTPVDESRYLNGIVLEQTDVDPNTLINLTSTPDTYNSTFRFQHTSLNRRFGEEFDETTISGFELHPLLRKTNPTTNPFWEADADGFDVNMNTDAKSGVGQKTGFKFIFSQDVGGHLTTCLGCGEGHDVTIPGGISYDQIFPLIPTIPLGSHPPQESESFTIIPNP